MPKLLALGGPRDGRLVFIDEGASDVSFQLMPPFGSDDEPLQVRYRRASVGGEEVLVHADVAEGADLPALLAAARAEQARSGQWPDDEH
jgi:hypothetical protein